MNWTKLGEKCFIVGGKQQEILSPDLLQEIRHISSQHYQAGQVISTFFEMEFRRTALL